MASFQILPLKKNMCHRQTILSWEYDSWLQNDCQTFNTALDGSIQFHQSLIDTVYSGIMDPAVYSPQYFKDHTLLQ